MAPAARHEKGSSHQRQLAAAAHPQLVSQAQAGDTGSQDSRCSTATHRPHAMPTATAPAASLCIRLASPLQHTRHSIPAGQMQRLLLHTRLVLVMMLRWGLAGRTSSGCCLLSVAAAAAGHGSSRRVRHQGNQLAACSSSRIQQHQQHQHLQDEWYAAAAHDSAQTGLGPCAALVVPNPIQSP
jgi:hypothetical protein